MLRSWLQRQVGDPEGQVLLVQAGVSVLTAAWLLFWPVPTEVVGTGVIIVPEGARVVDARAEGQILDIAAPVGAAVRKGEVLFRIYLPVLEQGLRQG